MSFFKDVVQISIFAVYFSIMKRIQIIIAGLLLSVFCSLSFAETQGQNYRIYPDAENDNLFSYDFYTQNKLKIAGGYTGYIVGAVSSFVVLAGVSGYPLYSLLVMPFGAAVGSALGVYAAGDMQEEQGSLVNTCFGAGFGSIAGTLLYMIPFAGLFAGPVPAVACAVKEYNKSAIRKNHYQYEHINHNLSINPVGTAISTGKIIGLSRHNAAPVKLGFESKLDRHKTWYNQITYKNSDIREYDYWLEKDNSGKWHEKQYGISSKVRFYQKTALEGFYWGLGSSLFYSSVSIINNSTSLKNVYPGKGWFIAPSLEAGYTCYLFDKVSLNFGYNLEIPVALNKTGSPEKNYQKISLSELLFQGAVIQVGYSF
ncbi:MAG: hypothetical protein GY730_09255 [bacterium]|nr:hypothetical protein [bacterium]